MWFAFPVDAPVWPSSPAVPVDKEGEVSVVEEELAIKPFDRDWDDVFAGDKVEGGIGVVEKWLGLQSFQTYNFEATGACDAKLRSQEVDGCRFGRDVEFL